MDSIYNNECERQKELISLYIDDELSINERLEFEEHISACDDCKAEYDSINYVVNGLKSLGTIELPEGFHEEIMMKIRTKNTSEVINTERKAIFLSFRKYASIAASFVFMCLLFTAVLRLFVAPDNGGQSQVYETAPGAPIQMASEAYGEAEDYAKGSEQSADASLPYAMQYDDGLLQAEDGAVELDSNRKEAAASGLTGNAGDINIKNYNLSIAAEDYNAAITAITAFDDYVISNNSYNYGQYENASIVLKVPVNDYYTIINQIKSLGNTESEYENEYIVAFDILNTNSALRAKEQEYSNLLSLIAKTETVSDMLVVENRMSQVGEDIENLESNLRSWNRERNYPTISVTVSEKIQNTYNENEKPLSERMKDSFINSVNFTTNVFEYFVLCLSYWFVPLLIIIVGGAATYSIYRFKLRRQRR